MAEEAPNTADKDESPGVTTAEAKAGKPSRARRTTKKSATTRSGGSKTTKKKSSAKTASAKTASAKTASTTRRVKTDAGSDEAASERGETERAPDDGKYRREDEREKRMRGAEETDGLLRPDRLIPLAWRLGGLLVFGFVAYMILMVLYLLGALQFLVIIVRGAGSEDLARLMDWLMAWMRQIVDYFAARTEARDMPFPFTPLPVRAPDE